MRYINHNVVWYSQTKEGSTSKYDKRTLLEDKITTYYWIVKNRESFISSWEALFQIEK